MERHWVPVEGFRADDHDGAVRALATLPSGDLLSGGGPGDVDVRVWKRRQGGAGGGPGGGGGSWRVALRLSGHALDGAVCALAALGADGRLFASGGQGAGGEVRVWSAAAGEHMAHLRKADVPETDITMALLGMPTNSAMLAAAGSGGRIRLWDYDRGALLHDLGGEELEAPTGARDTHPSVNALALGQGGLIMAAGTGGTVRLWDGRSKDRPAGELAPAAGLALPTIYALSANHAGTAVATGSEDGVVRVWDVRKPKLMIQVKTSKKGAIFALTTLSSGLLVAGGADKRLVAWDVRRGELACEQELAGPIFALTPALGPSGLLHGVWVGGDFGGIACMEVGEAAGAGAAEAAPAGVQGAGPSTYYPHPPHTPAAVLRASGLGASGSSVGSLGGIPSPALPLPPLPMLQNPQHARSASGHMPAPPLHQPHTSTSASHASGLSPTRAAAAAAAASAAAAAAAAAAHAAAFPPLSAGITAASSRARLASPQAMPSYPQLLQAQLQHAQALQALAQPQSSALYQPFAPPPAVGAAGALTLSGAGLSGAAAGAAAGAMGAAAAAAAAAGGASSRSSRTSPEGKALGSSSSSSSSGGDLHPAVAEELVRLRAESAAQAQALAAAERKAFEAEIMAGRYRSERDAAVVGVGGGGSVVGRAMADAEPAQQPRSSAEARSGGAGADAGSSGRALEEARARAAAAEAALKETQHDLQMSRSLGEQWCKDSAALAREVDYLHAAVDSARDAAIAACALAQANGVAPELLPRVPEALSRSPRKQLSDGRAASAPSRPAAEAAQAQVQAQAPLALVPLQTPVGARRQSVGGTEYVKASEKQPTVAVLSPPPPPPQQPPPPLQPPQQQQQPQQPPPSHPAPSEAAPSTATGSSSADSIRLLVDLAGGPEKLIQFISGSSSGRNGSDSGGSGSGAAAAPAPASRTSAGSSSRKGGSAQLQSQQQQQQQQRMPVRYRPKMGLVPTSGSAGGRGGRVEEEEEAEEEDGYADDTGSHTQGKRDGRASDDAWALEYEQYLEGKEEEEWEGNQREASGKSASAASAARSSRKASSTRREQAPPSQSRRSWQQPPPQQQQQQQQQPVLAHAPVSYPVYTSAPPMHAPPYYLPPQPLSLQQQHMQHAYYAGLPLPGAGMPAPTAAYLPAPPLPYYAPQQSPMVYSAPPPQQQHQQQQHQHQQPQLQPPVHAPYFTQAEALPSSAIGSYLAPEVGGGSRQSAGALAAAELRGRG